MSRAIADATLEYSVGNYGEVIMLLEDENLNRPKVLSMLGSSYFYTGRFEEAFKTYDKLFNDPEVYAYEMGCNIESYDMFGRRILIMLQKAKLQEFIRELPQNLNYNYAQSIESANEGYSESVDYMDLLTRCRIKSNKDPDRTYELVYDELMNMRNSSNIEDIAKSWFYQGEMNLEEKDYFNAHRSYLKAAQIDVNKALYYAYAGNMLLRMKSQNYNIYIFAMILNNRAINLDYSNSRWHFYSGMYMLALINCFSQENETNMKLFSKAKSELIIAKKHLRNDQIALQSEINKILELYF